MHEKPVKVDISFNEALRRIANAPKSVVPAKNIKKAAPSVQDSAAKVKLAKQR